MRKILMYHGTAVSATGATADEEAAAAKLRRVHAVEGRRLVQRDERIRIVPVAARLAMTVYQRDMRVGRFVDQRVGKGQAGGAAADDQVVGLKVAHVGSSRHGRAA